jgi:hypothetical protein
MNQEADGDYVHHSDHEAEVARLRAELQNAAKAALDAVALACEKEREADALRADAERWNWIMSNYYGGDLARTQKILGQCWTREQMEEAIDQRDRYHEMADELAGHIARIIGVDIGEHSSANCPWQNAIEAAEEYKPAQAIDLGALRDAVQGITVGFDGDLPYIKGIAEALALINKAVGNK